MDHAYISEIGLLLILVASFSRWTEVVYVHDRKTDDNGVPKTLVSDNAPEFYDVGLNNF